MLDPEELFVGGGILVIGICAAIGAALLTHFLIRYLHRGAARFLVNAFGYPIAGYILATTMYVAFDIYLHDLLVINTKYYSALIVFLGVWTVYRIGMSAVEYFFPADHHEPNRAGPVLKFALRVVIWGLGLMMILNTLEINITPLLAGAGIAGVAVALAAGGAFATDMDHKAKTIGSVVTRHAGTAEVTCNAPGGWTFDVRTLPSTVKDVAEVEIRLARDAEALPPSFSVSSSVPQGGIRYRWSADDRDFGVTPTWAATVKSDLAHGMPLYSFFAQDDENRLTLACTEARRSVTFMGGMREVTRNFDFSWTFFEGVEAPLRDYRVRFRFDRRRVPFADALRTSAAWVPAAAGFAPAVPPAAAYEPLYSTWYAFHRGVTAEDVERECAAAAELGGCDRIRIVEPLEVFDCHNIMARSYLILTDSGGIQEEAPSLGKPVLVMRDTTERPEGIAAGTLKLVGTDEQVIYSNFSELLDDPAKYEAMSTASNPYGDGFASQRIADVLENA